MANDELRHSATGIFYAALKAVNPYESVQRYAERIRSLYRSGDYNRVFLISIGKAACSMADAAEDCMTGLVDAGIIITKCGHAESCKLTAGRMSRVNVLEAGHPVPDERGLKATREVMKLLQNADEHTLVLFLISGGGSALLVSPYDGVTLADKQDITGLLLKAGADIGELNAVRKHLSNVKGGRLAEIAYPAKVISLILSDVIGDRLDVIASGPASPDSTTYHNALSVLKKYGLTTLAPQSVLAVLLNGAGGLIPETPKIGNKVFENVESIVIGSNKTALSAAKQAAEGMGFQSGILYSELTGEAKDAGKHLAEKAIAARREASGMKHDRKFCFISGGETTVTVKGNGLGGRNMELALMFARQIEGLDGITLLSAGTDGTDGPTYAAGAIVDGETTKKAKALGLDPAGYLAVNDSYNFFKKTGELFITGPTGTNVMDIQIILIE